MAKRKKHEITLELYTPHEMQRKLHESKARFRVGAFGRQSGKSTFGINELAAKAWENPRGHYWFLSPIFDQARLQFERLVEMLRDSGAIKKPNESRLTITFINGSKVTFKSGETLHRLRGATLDGVIIDEVRDQHQDLWTQVIRNMLTTTQGWAVFISTPKGYDQFYDFFEKGSTDEDWESFQAPSTCNPLFTQEEYESSKKDMSDGEFDQEINANFRDIQSGRAYCNYGTHNELLVSPFTGNADLFSPYLPLVIGLDFNITPMSWHFGQFSKEKCYWFDEIHLENSNTQEASLELVSRLKDMNWKGLIILCGDATGKARQRAAASNSDYDIIEAILKEHKFHVNNETPESNPTVKDRVNTMNTRLKAADGTVSFFLHPEKCPKLKKDFERVLWKDGADATLDPGKKRELTHASDSVGYPVFKFLPGTKIQDVGVLKVVSRR